MNITVIVCTSNRSWSLRNTLASLTASSLPAGVEWEVLVVDNNSTDETRTVVETFFPRFPDHFRYLFEGQPGKSYALNTGIRNARGQVLAFLDDDVLVEPSWLWNLTNALQQHDWSGVSGRTLLADRFFPPSWMATEGPYSMAGILAAKFDLGTQPCELRHLHQPPYGANMAFRKEMFDKYGLFRTDLGPSPDPAIPRPNEDTEFGRRLMLAKEKLGYEPSAVAYHPVPRQRVKKEYFLAWWFDGGRAAIRELGRRPNIFGIPRRYLTILKASATVCFRALLWTATVNPQARFFRKCRVWAMAGQIVEVNRLWR
jgi:glycosyltransferase involved in cell wall biosynthesis